MIEKLIATSVLLLIAYTVIRINSDREFNKKKDLLSKHYEKTAEWRRNKENEIFES